MVRPSFNHSSARQLEDRRKVAPDVDGDVGASPLRIDAVLAELRIGYQRRGVLPDAEEAPPSPRTSIDWNLLPQPMFAAS